MLFDLLQEQKNNIDYYFQHLDLAEVDKIVQMCLRVQGLIVFTGVGKSGFIAEKIAATLISTGTKALYLPPTNFLHGDIGIVLFDDEANDLRAYFRHADRNMRAINPQLLSSYETAFAMTTHKSQGSEFEKMMFLLPEIDSPLLTREIIYTGITRIKKELEIWGTENIFAAAVTKRISRTSALRELLLSL